MSNVSVIAPVREDIEDLQFRCRTLGHAWDPFTPIDFHKTSMWRRAVHLRCQRCHTERHDAIDSFGQVMARRYDYPDEYKMTADDRPSTENLRLWMLKRNKALGIR